MTCELQRWSWKQLKNIMYKEKKFIMEIIDNNSHSQLKHTISSPGVPIDHRKPQPPPGGEAIITHTWYSTPKVVLSLWRMAKVQHKFSKGKSTSVRKTIALFLLFIYLSYLCRVMHWTQLNWSRGWIHCWLLLATFGDHPARVRTASVHQDPVTQVSTYVHGLKYGIF